MAKHDMSKMSNSKTSAEGAMDMSEPSKHDMSNMEGSKTGAEGAMNMSGSSKHAMSEMAGSEPANDEVRAKKLQLEKMRELQAQLGRAYEREVATQKKEDARARELMEKDPHAHVEMMKMEQKHRELALELPRMLLQHEAQVYQELQSAQKTAQSKMPETGKMMMEMVGMARWSQIPLLVLGLWLIFSPFSLGYRSVALIWSDVISGILVTVLAVIAFRTKRVWAAWANTFVGLWLAFAPIAFWVPDAAAYANDTLMGMLVITFAVLIPMMMTMPGPEVPLGWSYNPASWQQRAPILALALLSFFLARYMTAFQLGHISWVWDPIFGDGTVKVLGSDLSKSFPISDGGLGAFVYLVELLSGFMGDPRRWRTMPWMVALFGLMVIPLGIVSVVLIMLQPIIIGEWCTVCLLSALFMLIMIALSLDEVIAMLQFLMQTRRAGKSVWRAFWLGGDALGDNLIPQRPQTDHASQMFWGITVPWNVLVIALLGAWLMMAPSVFHTQGSTAHSDHVLGALVVTVAIIAFAEVTRAARFINIALALGIIILPWLFGGATLASGINDLIIGVLIIALSISPGKIKNTYGEWNPLVV
ncbi:MAG: vitamin K epoxide reductase family protein, partial [Chloroflexota bacterium]